MAKSATMTLRKSASALSESARGEVAEALGASLADGLDLYSQIKVAHWNIKGSQFIALHELFDRFGVSVTGHNDTIAERLVTLGGFAHGTVRESARASKLSEYPEGAVRDLELVKVLAARFEQSLDRLRKGRDLAEEKGDTDTHDMLTVVITEYEKHSWFLLATLDA